LKTSLVMPCTPEHFLNISTILSHYAKGTMVPDEVIVSLSNSSFLNSEILDSVERMFSEKFPSFKILKHNRKLSHGPNRQAGSESSTGDLLIYGDADDIPHFKRVETIHHFFSNFDIVHLNHWWCREDFKFRDFSLDDVTYIDSQRINETYFSHGDLRRVQTEKPGGYGNMFGRVTAGHVAVKRDVLEKVRWKDWGELQFGPAEDWEFCVETLFHFKKSMILNADLIKYVSDSARNSPADVHIVRTLAASA
jgi:hypothetical protein